MQHQHLALCNEIVMIALVFLDGTLLVARETLAITPNQIVVFDHIDLAIAVIFLVEFCTRLLFAKDRKSFFRSYWWELLATIPVTMPLTQALRILRLFRVIRVIVHVRSAQTVHNK